jgi:hypothetical protein
MGAQPVDLKDIASNLGTKHKSMEAVRAAALSLIEAEGGF